MQSFLEKAVETLDGLLASQKYPELLENVESLLAKDVNNSQLLHYKLRALDGLGRGLDDIGFLRKYCWYRSLDAYGFFLLSQAFLKADDLEAETRLNAIVALVYANSIEPDNTQYSQSLKDVLQREGYEDVKLGILRTDRIGHLAFEPDMWLRQQALTRHDDNILYLFLADDESKAVNDFCYELICRYLKVLPNPYWMRIIKTRGPLLSDDYYCSIPYDSMGWIYRVGKHRMAKSMMAKYREMQSLCQRIPAIVTLTDEDKDKASTLLMARGIDASNPIVCLHVRDSAYLDSVTSATGKNAARQHDFRDADINTYIPTIEYLLQKGYTVVRMGTVTNQPLSMAHPQYFEFFDKPLESILEVYLAYICRFYIGTTSGPFALAGLFDKPFVVTNGMPLQPYVVGYCRTVPKVYLDPDGNELSFIELMENKHVLPGTSTAVLDCLDGNELQNYGFSWRENTEEELLNSIIEVESELESHVVTLKANSQQLKVSDKLSNECEFKHSKSHITKAFIDRNQHLF